MFSLESRINGMLIGYAYVHNIDAIGIESKYSVEYHRIGRKPNVMRFNIQHKREEGSEKLTLLIYQEIDKRLKKKDSSKKI